MQLGTLSIENIASLKGRHLIDFDQLRDSSKVFAITGPTGSGKSTILSSISLALFGSTAKGSLNASDFVTLGESFGSIHLNFSIGEKCFIAHWHCLVRKKNGELRSKPKITRLLRELDTGQECFIEDLIDLDLQQFNKVAILHQGRFADFLHATFTERKKLLETLIGDNILSTVGKNLNKVLNDYRRQIELLSGVSEQSLMLTEIEKKEHIDKKNELQETINKLTREYTFFRELTKNCEKNIEVSKKIPSLVKRIKQEELQCGEILKELNQTKKKEQSIQSTYNEYLLYSEKKLPEYKVAILHQQEINQTRETEEKITIKLNTQLAAFEKWNIEYINAQEKLSEIKKQLTGLNTNGIDVTNEKLTSLLTDYRYIESLMAQEGLTAQTLSEIKKTIQTYTNKIIQKKEDLKKAKSSLPTNILEYINKNELKQLKNSYQSLLETKEKYKSLKVLNDHKINELSNKDNQLNLLQDTVISNRSTLIDTEKQLDHYKELLKKQEVSHHIKAIISHLLEGEHEDCPICDNSISLELLKKNHNNRTSEETNETLLDRLKTEYEKAQQKLKYTQETFERLSNDIKVLKKTITSEQIELKELVPKIQHEEILKQEIETIENFLLTENSINNELKDTHAELSIIKKREHEHTVELSRSIEKRERFNLNDTKNLEDVKNKISTLTMLLDLLQKELDIKERVKNIKHQTDELKRECDQLLLKQKESEKKHITLKKEYLENSFPENPQIESDSIKIKLNDKKEAFRAIQTLRREVEFNEQKKQSLIRSLSEQKEDIDRIRLVYLSELKSIIKENKVTIQDLKPFQLEKLEKSYQSSHQEEYELTAVSSFYNEQLLPLVKQTQKHLTTCQEQFTTISTKLLEQEKQEKKLSKVKKQINNLKKELGHYEKLEHFVGKDKFRDYALSVVEKNLVKLANDEIQSFASGRYKLLHTKEGRASEFSIIDKWQGHQTRKISTLSGGETFMLSLALALALSRINRGSQEIGFFLIDEGFGSLDSDSIDEVMECLMNLHSQGKQIGLISHIKELTSRIPTCIELTKNQWGESSLETSL